MKLITEKSYNQNKQIEKEIKLFKIKPLKSFLDINLKNFKKKDKTLYEKTYLLSNSINQLNIDINKVNFNEIGLDKLVELGEISRIDKKMLENNSFIIQYSFFDDLNEYYTSFIYVYRLLIEIYNDIQNNYIYFLKDKISFYIVINYEEELDPNALKLTYSKTYNMKKMVLNLLMNGILEDVEDVWKRGDIIRDIQIIIIGNYIDNK